MENFLYFPSAVYREEKLDWLEILSSITDKYFSNMKERQELLVHQTNNMAGDKALSFLEENIKSAAYSILQAQGYSVENYEFYISAIWGHLIYPHGFHVTHLHRESSLCGFYFLETPKNGAYPVFEDPRPAKLALDLDSPIREEVTLATPSVHFNNIKPGTILIANSWLPHRFEPNRSTENTKLIHFTVAQNKRGI